MNRCAQRTAERQPGDSWVTQRGRAKNNCFKPSAARPLFDHQVNQKQRKFGPPLRRQGVPLFSCGVCVQQRYARRRQVGNSHEGER
jgi:hypothetical protein